MNQHEHYIHSEHPEYCQVCGAILHGEYIDLGVCKRHLDVLDYMEEDDNCTDLSGFTTRSNRYDEDDY